MRGDLSRTEPDAALVQRARMGDQAALRSLLEIVSPTVRQWALARTGDPEQAADLAQEVLVLLVRKLGSFRGDSRFLTWVFTVTRNQAVEHHRRQKRVERKMKRFAARIPRSGAVPAEPVEAALDAEKMGKVLHAFVEALPERQREVFLLSEVHGLTGPEVGGILGLKPGSVRAALFKARRALRKRILDAHPEFVEEYLS